MSRPTIAPEWASDANFPAGSDDWSGEPTRTEPSSGEKGTGFIPQDKLPADYLNFLLGNLADWVNFFEETRAAGFFGDGSDGDVSLDGSVAAPSGMSKSGATYTLLRDFYADDLTLTSTAQVYTAGFRLFVRGTLDIGASAKVQCNGFAGSGITGGNGTSATGSMLGSQAGGAGGTVGDPPGDAGGSTTSSIGGAGGAGGYGDSTGSDVIGSAGGTAAAPSAANGGYRSAFTMQTAIIHGISGGAATTLALQPGAGGGGGHYGNDGANEDRGGGGGGGGGLLLLSAAVIVNAGAIEANGGAGGNFTHVAGGGSSNAGGGGGGGGGAILLTYGYKSGAGTITANGGAGGSGTFPGVYAGVAGSAGTIVEVDLSA